MRHTAREKRRWRETGTAIKRNEIMRYAYTKGSIARGQLPKNITGAGPKPNSHISQDENKEKQQQKS